MLISKRIRKRSKVVILLVLISGFTCFSNIPYHASEKMNRNQLMLLNLKTAPQSAGYYLVNSYHNSKEISKDLESALNQMMAVDKTYAKYRHRPDDRFLQSACLKVTLARQTAQELEQQLQDAFAELKSSIEETLITDEHFPDKKRRK